MTRPEATNINTVEENGGTNELNNMEHLPLLVEQHAVPMIAHPECKNQKHKDTEVKSVADVSQEGKCPLGQKISSSSCSPINIGVSVANKPENDMIVHNETNATLVRTNEAPMKNDPDSSAISAN